MSYEPTINNGGPPVRVSREPVDKPDHIVRGEVVTFQCCVSDLDMRNERVTFGSRYGGFAVTYHRALLYRVRGDTIWTIVEPDTVVTWERIPLQ